MIQPQVPLRLPCDDLAHLTELRFALPNKARLIWTLLEWLDGRCVQGAGTYSPEDFKPGTDALLRFLQLLLSFLQARLEPRSLLHP